VRTSDRKTARAKWPADYDLAYYPGKVINDGVQATIDTINAFIEPITLLAIGPQTNVRVSLDQDAAIASKVRAVSMAGSIEIGYNGRKERVPGR